MSTEYRTQTTDELVGYRYCGRQGLSFDWGHDVSRVLSVFESGDQGEQFVDETGQVLTGGEFRTLVDSCEWTFGEFGGTVELGSGDFTRFLGL